MLTIFNNKREFQSSNCTVAVLPLGAVEQHGSHLPVGTDIIISSELARRVAEEINAYLLPVIPITCSIEHRESKGTVYIRAATLSAMIRDIAESLQYSGYKKLYLINGHAGNWILKPTIRELNREFPNIEVVLVSTQSARERMLEIFDYALPHDIHAGETETSVIMYLQESLVSEINLDKEKTLYPQDFLDYFDMSEITSDGYWGHPENASSEKGEKWINMLLEAALDYIQKINNTQTKLQATSYSNKVVDRND